MWYSVLKRSFCVGIDIDSTNVIAMEDGREDVSLDVKDAGA